MRYGAPVEGDWDLVETVIRGEAATKTVYEEANDVELKHVLSQLILLRAAGCPADRERGNPRIEKWRKYQPTKPGPTYTIYVLKAKPSRWRLYFYVVNHDERQIEIIYVVSKKEDPRNPADFGRCCHIIDGIRAGSHGAQRVALPDTR